MTFALPISPLQLIPEHPGVSQGISLFVKRDDLLHPNIQGSKGRKLAAIFPFIRQTCPGGVVTFGGAFSNHLHAVAVAGRLFGVPTYGILRGAYADLSNPTLRACLENGMTLIPWPKLRYDACKQQGWERLQPDFPGCYILPEGGNTPEALKACASISAEILDQLPASMGKPLYLCVPAGTGCTAAGMIAGLTIPNSEVMIFPVSSQDIDHFSILQLLANAGLDVPDLETRFQFQSDYIFGGFAKLHPPVMDFVHTFLTQTNILLDPIYTAKMFYGIFDLLSKGAIPENSTVVALHSGGIQGWEGFRERYGKAVEVSP